MAEQLRRRLAAARGLFVYFCVWVAYLNFMALVLGVVAWAPLRHVLEVELSVTQAAAAVFVLLLAQTPVFVLVALCVYQLRKLRDSEHG